MKEGTVKGRNGKRRNGKRKNSKRKNGKKKGTDFTKRFSVLIKDSSF